DEHPHEVRQSRSLHWPVPAEIGAVRQQYLFHLVRLAYEFAPDREKSRDDSRNVWRGHTGATHLHVELFRILAVRRYVVPAGRDSLAGSDAVRLLPAVRRRPARGKVGYAVGMRIHLVHGSDRDRLVQVRRVADREVHVRVDGTFRRLERYENLVSSGVYHDDPLPPQTTQFPAKRGVSACVRTLVE